MKKVFIICMLVLGLSLNYASLHAGDIQVTVSEDLSQLIPGDCTPKPANRPAGFVGPLQPTGYYECPVQQGFGSVQTMIGNTIQYATFLIGLVGVLFIVINGIMYSIGGDDKSGAKDRIMKSVSGLLLLLLSGVVLNAIAPWVYSI